MIRERQNIVCLSTIDWDFNWQGHQEIMATLARQGHRVLFIENTGVRSVKLKDLPRLRHRLANWRKGVRGIRKVIDNLYVYAPIVLPFPYSRVARLINKTVMFWTLKSWTRSMRFENPIIWTWLPTALALDLIRILDGQLVVYYCCDNFEATSPGSRRIRESEDELLRKADLVFAHSRALYDRCSRFADQVHVFQYGFNREVFARVGDRLPADLAPIPRPILGYVGGVHQHVDQDLLAKVARAHSDKSLVMVGPLQTEVNRLQGLPNVHFLGQKRYEELPAYINRFDLGLIPYALNDYTRTVFPTKLNEYLILGKPVVSTSLPEVAYFNSTHQGVVSIADGPAAFVKRIGEELAGDSDVLRARRIKQVEKNAWAEKIEAMTCLIQAKLEEQAKSREMNWQETLVRVYRTSRRKALAALCSFGLAYLLLFHTPILWWLAEPLRFADPPQPADAIVVLAGGIGESGEPGEEYQEKVEHGVKLYRQGYAQHIVFSSGVGYVFKEAQVMKALAVSLGVPAGVILLDERGGGNYASLLNVKRILESRGWTRILLVTSRYNTARSRLVIEKHLPAFQVRFTPASRSAFFGDRGPVAWKHVRAILHE